MFSFILLFGCAEPLLILGFFSSCSMRAYCGDISGCGAWALGHVASVVASLGSRAQA